MTTLLRYEDIASVAQALPEWLEKERSLCGMLEELGVDASELAVLRGDRQLLSILAEEVDDPGAESSRQILAQVLRWHDQRLARVATTAVMN